MKHISTFDFSTLYTAFQHNSLIQVHQEVIHFVFKSKIKKKLVSLILGSTGQVQVSAKYFLVKTHLLVFCHY